MKTNRNLLNSLFTILFAFVAMTGCKYETVDDRSICSDNSDCPSGQFCNIRTDMRVCLDLHCEDNVTSSDETGVDCGGSCNSAYRCRNTEGCNVDKDCISDNCVNHVCVGLPNGSTCNGPLQCLSEVCTNGVCGGQVTTGCTSNSQCNNDAQVCVSGNPNFCSPCSGTGQGNCSSGRLCQSGACVVPQCTSNFQCPVGRTCNSRGECEDTSNNTCSVTCPVGTQCSPLTNTCVSNGGAFASCTNDSGCQQGLNCVNQRCQAPLGVSSNMNPSAFLCWPFAGRTEIPVTPSLNTVTVFNGTAPESRSMYVCPNNGVFGSIAMAASSAPSAGVCTGIGAAYTNTIVSCQTFAINPSSFGIQR